MPDYPMPDPSTSTPASTPDLRLDAAAIGELLATLERIPRDELPDGADRETLAYLIKLGLVDNLYRPHCRTHHVISWTRAPIRHEQREWVSDWLEARHSFARRPQLRLVPLPEPGGELS